MGDICLMCSAILEEKSDVHNASLCCIILDKLSVRKMTMSATEPAHLFRINQKP